MLNKSLFPPPSWKLPPLMQMGESGNWSGGPQWSPVFGMYSFLTSLQRITQRQPCMRPFLIPIIISTFSPLKIIWGMTNKLWHMIIM